MMRIFLFTLFISIPGYAIYGQSYFIKKTPFWAELLSMRSSIKAIHNFPTKDVHHEILPFSISKLTFAGEIISDTSGLYVLSDGAGFVYKARESSNDSIEFYRLDSTPYFGHNFGAIRFIYNGTIYSLGGYGFWRNHGQLSYFREGLNWCCQPVSEELQGNKSLFNYLDSPALIFYASQNGMNEIDGRQNQDIYINKLDLTGFITSRMGRLSKFLDKPSEYQFIINVPSLNGTLIFLNNEIYLLDFLSNKLYVSNSSEKFEKLLNKPELAMGYIFENKGTIYFNYSRDKSLLKIPISKSDFKDTGLYVYETEKNLNTKFLIAIAFFIITVLAVFWYKLKSKRKEIPSHAGNTGFMTDQEAIGNASTDFSTAEIDFVRQVYDKSQRTGPLKVEEVNFILGLKKKSVEVQKKIRTETLNRINYKYRELTNQDSDLVQRSRSEDDKRYYNYFIATEDFEKFIKGLN